MATFFRKGEKIWKSISKGCIAFDFYIPMDFVKIRFVRRGCDSNIASFNPAPAPQICKVILQPGLHASAWPSLKMICQLPLTGFCRCSSYPFCTGPQRPAKLTGFRPDLMIVTGIGPSAEISVFLKFFCKYQV